MIESKLDPGRGPVVTLLVQRGTLKVGDALVAGAHWGARARDARLPRRAREAGPPGEPVEILGFDGVPEAGENFRVVENDRRARQLAGERANRLKTEALARRQGVRVSLEDVFARAQRGRSRSSTSCSRPTWPARWRRSQDEIAKLPQDQVAVNVIHDGVGGINESDVMLAAASDAIVIGFNVRPVGDARQIAEHEGVEIRTYSVIYHIVEELRAAMEGMLEPEEVEEHDRHGRGARHLQGLAHRHDRRLATSPRARSARRQRRLVRDGTSSTTAAIGSLRRFKDDVREVEAGFECGIVLRELPRREGGGRDRGLRDAAGRARAVS